MAPGDTDFKHPQRVPESGSCQEQHREGIEPRRARPGLDQPKDSRTASIQLQGHVTAFHEGPGADPAREGVRDPVPVKITSVVMDPPAPTGVCPVLTSRRGAS